MPEILAHNGEQIRVSLCDLKRARRLKWYVTYSASNSYAYALMRVACRAQRVTMHRYLMRAKPGQTVDHKNRNGLDNRRSNLHFVDRSQNAANRITRAPKSGYIGVVRVTRVGYEAVIYHRGARVSAGVFSSAALAALARDKLARKHYGPITQLNFPRGNEWQKRKSK